MKDVRALLAMLIVSAAATVVHAQIAQWSDADFSPGGPGCTADDMTTPGESHALAGYTLVTDVRFGSVGYVCFEQRAAGGNPDAYAHVTIRPNIQPDGGQTIACMFRDDVVHDPAVDGAFGSVTYSEDAICFEPAAQCMSTGVCILQGDPPVLYFARVGFVANDPPTVAWSPRGATFGAADFSRLSASGPADPDFTASGAPLQFGLYRGKSGGGGEETGIDNWVLTLDPPCGSDADCDNGDACTIDTCNAGACERTPIDCSDGNDCTLDECTAGVCSNPPLDCDDGNVCTDDFCSFGQCANTVAADFATVEAQLTALIATIEAGPCGQETLVKKVVKKLRKRLAKARKRFGKAGRTTKDKRIAKLIDKGISLLGKAQAFIDVALTRQLVSPACAAVLSGLVTEAETCAFGLPRPPV